VTFFLFTSILARCCGREQVVLQPSANNMKRALLAVLCGLTLLSSQAKVAETQDPKAPQTRLNDLPEAARGLSESNARTSFTKRHRKLNKKKKKKENTARVYTVVANGETAVPTFTPSETPSTVPSKKSTEEFDTEPLPTFDPTTAPTDEPTGEPTDEPTTAPTDEPTDEPTAEPTGDPTDEPTTAPTDEPTDEPTKSPVADPTAAPTSPTLTENPTTSLGPSLQAPSESLGKVGSPDGSQSKTSGPTSVAPTLQEAPAPTTMEPTSAPTTMEPTSAPTTIEPTSTPTTIESTSAPTISSRRLSTRILVTTLSIEEREAMERTLLIAQQRESDRRSVSDIAADTGLTDSFVTAADVLRDLKGGKIIFDASLSSVIEVLEEHVIHNTIEYDADGTERNLKKNEWKHIKLSYAPETPDFAVTAQFYWIQLDLPFDVSSTSDKKISDKQFAELENEANKAIQKQIKNGKLLKMLQAKDSRIQDVSDAMIREVAPVSTLLHSAGASSQTFPPIRLAGILLMVATVVVGAALPLFAKRARDRKPSENAEKKRKRKKRNFDLSTNDAVNDFLDKGRPASGGETETDNVEEGEYDHVGNPAGSWDEASFTFGGGSCMISEFRTAYSEEYDDMPESLMEINITDTSNPSVMDFHVTGPAPAPSLRRDHDIARAEQELMQCMSFP
jgi:hypothetical protein